MAQGNFGRPEEHAEAGRKGGKASSSDTSSGFQEQITGSDSSSNSGQFEKDDAYTKKMASEGGKASDNTDNLNNQ